MIVYWIKKIFVKHKKLDLKIIFLVKQFIYIMFLFKEALVFLLIYKFVVFIFGKIIYKAKNTTLFT